MLEQLGGDAQPSGRLQQCAEKQGGRPRAGGRGAAHLHHRRHSLGLPGEVACPAVPAYNTRVKFGRHFFDLFCSCLCQLFRIVGISTRVTPEFIWFGWPEFAY